MVRLNRVLEWNSVKIGLVLSGGGAKGAYEAGVMTALHDLDIANKVSVVSGTSIGAINMMAFPVQERELCEAIWKKISYKDVVSTKDFTERVKERGIEILSTDKIKDIILRNIDIQKVTRSNINLYACAYSLAEMRPEYFHLNTMSSEDMIQAVLASAAIPYMVPPVEVKGLLYADGGVNDPLYPKPNSDLTPIVPLESYDLDLAIVVYLSRSTRVKKDPLPGVTTLNIIPSASLEIVRGTGTMDFTKGSIEERIRLGYRDALAVLAPYVMGYLTEAK